MRRVCSISRQSTLASQRVPLRYCTWSAGAFGRLSPLGTRRYDGHPFRPLRAAFGFPPSAGSDAVDAPTTAFGSYARATDQPEIRARRSRGCRAILSARRSLQRDICRRRHRCAEYHNDRRGPGTGTSKSLHACPVLDVMSHAKTCGDLIALPRVSLG